MKDAAWLVLALCAVLFALRVLGQVVVAVFAPRWLPAMENWYSGLMPYRYLLPAQIVLLALMILITADVYRMDGFFAASGWQAVAALLRVLAVVYFLAMVVRYALTMVYKSERRWFKGTIPIWFHMVLATALWTFGSFHAT